MEFRPASGALSDELARLRESGALAGGVALLRSGRPDGLVLVRPVIGDELAGWMPDVEAMLGIPKGVVGVTGTDMVEAASFAARAAAWLGDRGKQIVLVDAVVERPVIGKALHEDSDEGLVDAVLFGVSADAVVRRTLAPGVSVVTAGSHPLSIDSVFESDGFPELLIGLGSEALVLVLVPPTRVSTAARALSAAVCVAESSADIESLASCVEGVRTTGVLIGDEAGTMVVAQPTAAEAEVAEPDIGEPDVAETIVTEPDVTEMTVADADVAETTVTEPGDLPVEPEEREATSRAQPPAQERRVASATAGGVATGRGPTYRRAAYRTRRGPSPLAIVAVVLLVAAVGTLFWWFVLGGNEASERTEPPVETAPIRTADGGDSGVRQDSEMEQDSEMVQGSEEGEDTPATPGIADEAPVAQTDGTSAGPSRASPGPGVTISGPGGPYRIMISSHRYEGAARYEAGELLEQGVAVEVVPTEVQDRGTWFRVVVSGGYRRMAEAREVLDTIKTLGYQGAWIERDDDNE